MKKGLALFSVSINLDNDHCNKINKNGYTVKHVLSHSKIEKTKVFKTDYRLMQVKTIAECSSLEHSAIFLTYIKR